MYGFEKCTRTHKMNTIDVANQMTGPEIETSLFKLLLSIRN